MVIFAVAFAILFIIAFFVFIQLSEKHMEVQKQRIALSSALMREHKYWHKCAGGLGIDYSNGVISHFRPGEEADYDAERLHAS